MSWPAPSGPPFPGHDILLWLTLPAAAQRDYREYRRVGGRFNLAVWWERYQNYYQQVTS